MRRILTYSTDHLPISICRIGPWCQGRSDFEVKVPGLSPVARPFRMARQKSARH
jgi:hypothetical protein